jgi:sigma-E factor negative regulatory protein RseB
MMNSLWRVAVLGIAAASASGVANSADEGLAWLTRMASASSQVNYSGTFVYHNRGTTESSRVVHYVNQAGGVFEKLEALDGPAREVIRTNDQVTCYLPAIKTVRIEQRNSKLIPGMLPENLAGISESYRVRVGGEDRVAGHECRIVVLEPKDALRYGREFCAEAKSALPLRVRTISDKNEAIESFAFTELSIGGSFSRDKVKSKYAAKSRGWRVDRAALNLNEREVDTGWAVTQQPAGFKKLVEVKRHIAGRAGAVAQIIFSDGLAAVSVFIEPSSGKPASQTLTHQGAVNIYTRPVADHLVTVLGEAPAATIMQIGNSLEPKAGTAAR